MSSNLISTYAMLGYALLCYIHNDHAKNEQNGIETTTTTKKNIESKKDKL